MNKLIIGLGLILASANAMAEQINYTCESSNATGIIQEWDSVLDMDLMKGDFHSYKDKNIISYKLKNNPAYVQRSNESKGVGDLSTILYLSDEINSSVIVYGGQPDGNVKAADVLYVSPNDAGDYLESYYCYRKGSTKDKIMTEIRHNLNKGKMEGY